MRVEEKPSHGSDKASGSASGSLFLSFSVWVSSYVYVLIQHLPFCTYVIAGTPLCLYKRGKLRCVHNPEECWPQFLTIAVLCPAAEAF